MKIPKILIFNKEAVFQCVLTTYTPKGCPFYNDQAEFTTDYGATFHEFTCPANHPLTSKIEEEGYCAIYDQDGELILYRIRTVEEIFNSDGTSELRVYSENDALDLLNTPVRPITLAGYTLSQALNQILQGTGWEAGIIEFLGTRTFTIDKYMTALKAVHQLRSDFNCEIRFRIKMKGNRIVKRLIDISSSFGRYTGHRFEVGKDIASVIKKKSTKDLATAVIGVGAADETGKLMTFEDIVWSKAKGNPVDKPAGQDWVGDSEALQKWGKEGQHLFYIFESESQTPERLLSESYEVLQNRKEPKVEIEIEALLLERLSGYESDRKRLGDTVIARVTAFNPVFTASVRIKSMVLSQTDPSRDKVTLSNYKELNSSLNKSIVEQLQDLLRKKQAAWDAAEANANAYTEQYAEKSIHRGTTPPTDKTQIWIDTSDPSQDVWKRWDEEKQAWVEGPGGPQGPQGVQGKQGPTGLKLKWNLTNVTVDDQGRIWRSGGTDNTWNSAKAYTSEAYTGGAFLSFKPAKATSRVMMALNTDPATDDNYTSLDYAWYMEQNSTAMIFESGVSKGSYPFVIGDVFSIVYDNSTIKYYHNGQLKRTVNVGPNQTFSLDTAFYHVDESYQIYDIVFLPSGSVGPQGQQGPQGLQGLQGPKGDQGIQGPPGADGKNSYTHIAYANSADGTVGFSVSDSVNKEYIGIYVDFIEADSTNPAMYKWTLIKGADGAQGIPGPKGADGQTPYFHTAWATNATGTAGFSTTDATGKTYIGTYTDYTAEDSADPSKYTWSLIQGPKGDKGDTGATGPQGPQGLPGSSNLMENGDFETDTAGGNPKFYQATSNARVKDISGFTSGNGSTKALEIDAKNVSNSDVHATNLIPVVPGQKFYVNAEGRYLNTAGTGSGRIGFRAYNAARQALNIWSSACTWNSSNKELAFTTKEGVYTVPTGVYFIQPWISFSNNGETTNKFYIDNIHINRMVTPELIVDGAIYAKHIASLLGLNVNDQFIVDANGNVTFAGNLNGANGTFSGNLLTTLLTLMSPDSDITGQVRFRMGSTRTLVDGSGYVDDGFYEFNSWNGNLFLSLKDLSGNSISQGVRLEIDGSINPKSIVTESWIAPALLNGWVNFGSGYEAAGYYKDSMGVIHLKGFIKGGVVGSSPIFILPAGYRPSSIRRFALLTYNGTVNSLGALNIDSAGNVYASAGGNQWATLEGISFRP